MERRQIKLKAWNDNGKYWHPLDDDGDYFFYDNGNGLELHDKHGRCKNTTIVQFTGLLDKNKTEIYEGDIVECKSDVHSDEYHKGVATFAVETCEAGFNFGGIGWYQSEIEVIGNVFEHPELIKQKEEVK